MWQSPPAYLNVGTSTQVSAVVTNDIANAGVDWVAICSSANCGTFSPSHTAPGENTTYTAPLGVPSNGKISITALSSTDRSKSAASSVVIISTVTAIAITPPFPASVGAGSVLNLAATVTGDPADLGVDWKATCTTPVGPLTCSPSGLHSPAGGTIPFVVPQMITIPGTTQVLSLIGTVITVTAYATADHGVSAFGTFTVSAALSISITQAPPATMLTGATAPVIAVVSNDTSNSGVNWAVSCISLVSCGSVTPIQTASGVAATFTAPSTVPSPNPPPGLQVTITAYAAAASNNSVLSSVTVNIIAPVSVSITQGVPNNIIVQNATAPLIATVSNDSANAGVDWTVTCGSPGTCGSFAPTHTASGVTTMYTSPGAVPAGGTVTITATSTADPTQNARSIVTVTNAPPPLSLLQGQFIFSLSARTSQNGPYVLAGAITGDGNGNITGGNIDIADASGNATSAGLVTIVSPSTYFIDQSGRGTITLTINTLGLNTNFGVRVTSGTSTLTLSVVFISPQHAVLTEMDAFGNGTGALDLQNASDLASFQSGSLGINGSYSLLLSGAEVASPNALHFLASAITTQAAGTSSTLTGYITDQTAGGAVISVPFTAASQSFPNTRPGVNGIISLNSVNLGLSSNLNLDLWLIDASHFVVIDWLDAAIGHPATFLIGYLTMQSGSPSVTGAYAFTSAGAGSAAQSMVAGGIIACGSAGIVDVVISSPGTGLNNQPVTSTCSVPANGRSLISISGAASSGVSQFAAYPTQDRGLYLIELDGTAGPSSAGVALPQTLPAPPAAPALAAGAYASVFSAGTALGSQNFTARVNSDGINNLSGAIDVNSFDTTAAPPTANPSMGASLAGLFTAASNGRLPLALTLTPASGQPSPQIGSLNTACYVVDTTSCLLLGLDATASGTGVLQMQSTGL